MLLDLGAPISSPQPGKEPRQADSDGADLSNARSGKNAPRRIGNDALQTLSTFASYVLIVRPCHSQPRMAGQVGPQAIALVDKMILTLGDQASGFIH